jgi:hypothetical protein
MLCTNQAPILLSVRLQQDFMRGSLAAQAPKCCSAGMQPRYSRSSLPVMSTFRAPSKRREAVREEMTWAMRRFRLV